MTKPMDKSEFALKPALQAVRITKVFPGTAALQQIDFDVQAGAVNVLMGENGAGKSTLMRILAGIETPTSGQLFLDGRAVHLGSAAQAAQHGIAMVHQELSLMPNLTVAENIFAGRELRRSKLWIDTAEQERQTRVLLKRLDLNVSPRTQLASLSIGQQQLVEIARALGQRARILILDEPTSALSSLEIKTLFQVLRDLKSSGVAIVYVSHRLQELLELGDVFTVLRDGRLVATAPRQEVSESWIVERMTGGRLTETGRGASTAIGTPQDALRVAGLTVEERGHTCLRDISFRLGRGEIVGIYGLLGAGRTELFETLIGLRRESAGEILLGGRSLRGVPTPLRLEAGIRLVPEDRQRDGLIPQMSIRANASLSHLQKLCRGGWLSATKERMQADSMLSKMRLKPCNLIDPVSTLSGGNQQKALLARALLTLPAVLLLDEPTRGVDVGAKAEIYALIRKMAAEGVSILFSSSDSHEIRELAGRVLVLCRGALVAEIDAATASDEKLLLLADATCKN
jgi:erythritol transport system ATP-binding protein